MVVEGHGQPKMEVKIATSGVSLFGKLRIIIMNHKYLNIHHLYITSSDNNML